MYGLPCYPPSAIGYGLVIATISYHASREGIGSHLVKTFGAIYIVFIIASIAGFIAAPAYIDLAKNIGEELGRVRSHEVPALIRYIFVNNLAISLIAMAPVYGSIYLGWGLGNAALYYGVFLALKIAKGDYTPLALLIMPHTFLELLAYAVFIVLSTRVMKLDTQKFIAIVLLGVTLLILASLVETLTILILQD